MRILRDFGRASCDIFFCVVQRLLTITLLLGVSFLYEPNMLNAKKEENPARPSRISLCEITQTNNK